MAVERGFDCDALIEATVPCRLPGSNLGLVGGGFHVGVSAGWQNRRSRGTERTQV